jgi:hypothetical protein
VDLRAASGPTEFIPESHRNFDVDRTPVLFELQAGQCLLFDYRVKVGQIFSHGSNQHSVSGLPVSN